ncbi:uncharacterized protein E0L32_004158 [Thyridium curvatum]|uniref:UBX domain-containing protein n=1 Tax=Thyridium curvatum TaxID=1093900 RepID=A0A507B901_9PEZI|nr:uncharacterized protein E0L32_004158 [Thyridium curvatum]TPX16163.1 hypothetical protein E0L32_004158 [Thyridium curvatum]
MDDDAIASFMDITGADENVARTVLGMTDGDLSQACTLYFDNPDIASTVRQAAPAPSASQPQQTATGRARAGREDASGVIHIDSEDEGDDDVEMINDSDDDRAAVAEAARLAQEDEDAAMARRLQEELYSSGGAGGQRGAEDDVRAPLARTTETLVAPTYGMSNDEDMHDALLNQLRQRRQQRQAAPRNPFAQSIWNDPDAAPLAPPSAGGPMSGPAPNSRAARLAELFRPPYDLMSPYAWEEARSEGKEEKKWILVNLQDMGDFNCQVLNRDIWKDEAIRQLVRESFIFLQYSKDDPQALEYIQFYLREGQHENPDNFPHVAIVDPRTGEQVKVWSGLPFPAAPDFHAQLVEFLDRYSLAVNSKNPVAKQARPRTVDVDRMTEDEMLRMAMQNSLESANGGGGAKVDIYDPDELTKSNPDIGKGKGKAVAEPIDLTGGAAGAAEQQQQQQQQQEEEPSASQAAAAAAESAFARIAPDRPHAEPAPDPATVTRIQFRHPEGRVIRRFAVADTVERIYEWLKAEPLEGKEGVAFELKMMPQGRDLLEDLGKTIGEAGLKQGTVMIEFIED